MITCLSCLTYWFKALRGYPGENHAKGATAHITDLAHTWHID